MFAQSFTPSSRDNVCVDAQRMLYFYFYVYVYVYVYVYPFNAFLCLSFPRSVVHLQRQLHSPPIIESTTPSQLFHFNHPSLLE